ncbi:MAG TPA: ATP:cob(I)alamin adenosyltransferase [Anaerolineaceae bacterium]|jgi:cob(I)alamin adenosyltransferase|nr:ATP:cob(I)alamin adenosyltransferase [Anaerolineaceae bacterium]HOR83838.1 ATP:cob(I)alamin adenosyltransferase [Anaerolineaceae bacterium]HPL42638.1 ATP:cob(I)alamin adenosyltransferase [Anaerolineaceae bacterium]HPY32743.1 ATP:cob(I)alamin adenosyltransferase [Anaerolineaceae bacterium]HQC20444.1 ATP:cob(I)alamin adenosyltransferase [Anaerolineaceae bacterium]
MTPRRPLARKPGFTGLINEDMVSKADIRLRAIGAIDEASASLGLAKAFLADESAKDNLTSCQKHLSLIMAGLAGWKPENFVEELALALDSLEAMLTDLERRTKKPSAFLQPGQTPAEGALDMARALARRAERETVSLAQSPFGAEVPEDALTYLNRLSSLCFILLAAQAANGEIQ